MSELEMLKFVWFVGTIMSYFFLLMFIPKKKGIILDGVIVIALALVWIVSIPMIFGIVFSELLQDE